jgi:hypothetical protein
MAHCLLLSVVRASDAAARDGRRAKGRTGTQKEGPPRKREGMAGAQKGELVRLVFHITVRRKQHHNRLLQNDLTNILPNLKM